MSSPADERDTAHSSDVQALATSSAGLTLQDTQYPESDIPAPITSINDAARIPRRVTDIEDGAAAVQDESLELKIAEMRSKLSEYIQEPTAMETDALEYLAQLSVVMKRGYVEYIQASADRPLPYRDFPINADAARSKSMSFAYDKIDHNTHFRLFRMGRGQIHEPVTGTLTTYSYSSRPEYVFIVNASAYSNEVVSTINIDNQTVAVSKGLEYLLRWIRTGQDSDFHYFIPVLCLDASEPKNLEKVWSSDIKAMDAMEAMCAWDEEDWDKLRREDLTDQTTRLSHRRELDGYGWCGKYTPIHMPLDRTINEIRVLSLTIVGGQPHFYTWHTTATERNMYVAISYAWGEGGTPHTVMIDNNPVSISQNLYDFLQATIKRTLNADSQGEFWPQFLTMWIDALCINQNDEREKLYLIKRMHEIYSKAASVIAWIGQGDLQVFLAMRQALDNAKNRPDRDKFMYQTRMRAPLEVDPYLCKALMDTFARPFWTRAWTTQELVSAKVITVQCGTDQVLMEYLAPHAALYILAFLQVFESHPAALQDKLDFMTGKPLARPGLIYRYKARLDSGKPLTLLSLLLATLNMRSKYPKDKLYSLWSVAKDAPELLGHLDYQKSDAQVFTDLAINWIRTYQRMDILSIRAHPSRTSLTPDCPTWVVDWQDEDRACRPLLSSFPSRARLDILDDPEYNRRYDACRGLDFLLAYLSGGHDPFSTEESPALITAGVSCDTVVFVTEVHEGLMIGEDWLNFSDDDDLYDALVAGYSPEGVKIAPADPNRYFEDVEGFNLYAYADALLECQATDDPDEYVESRAPGGDQYFENLEWRQHIQNNCIGRRLAVTAGGQIGLVPETAAVGDEIVLIFNCSVPLVFRPLPKGLRWLIGDAYFRRMMNGEIIESLGGGGMCLADLVACVVKQTAIRLSQDPDNDEKVPGPSGSSLHVPEMQSKHGNTHDPASDQAPASTPNDSGGPSGTATALPALEGIPSRTPDMTKSDWWKDIDASFLDLIGAATRQRKPEDETAWVQTFYLPGWHLDENAGALLKKITEERQRKSGI